MGLLDAGSGGWCLRPVTECKTGRPVGRWRPASPLVGDSSMVVSVGAYALRLETSSEATSTQLLSVSGSSDGKVSHSLPLNISSVQLLIDEPLVIALITSARS